MEIREIVSSYCRENGLQIRFSAEMPEGYETANGTFDITKNTLFFNAKMLAGAPDFEKLFYLFHELRHVLQYTRPEQFPPILQRSLNYVLLYDGTCYKMVQGDWVECRIQGADDDLADAYLGQPYEMDANNYAYKKVKAICGVSPELDKLYSFWMPKNPLSEEEYRKIYAEIDEKTESQDS